VIGNEKAGPGNSRFAEMIENRGENAIMTKHRLDLDLEAEAQRLVCLQVVAGPRNEPTTARKFYRGHAISS